eukprot:CAMPEP_0115723148 /NCGR_PEP_ID=MMETSP0272-20121206/80077_1 /TAXON_ID=71861 /ORGANISM="Scrippsiella trochoidea, Strain CCMP3099" /LENGTH=95 /DNA_ID=CAMNT_0003166259 /DNA_START=11 /DNA_END=296 /DNA_ORIENTATION=+
MKRLDQWPLDGRQPFLAAAPTAPVRTEEEQEAEEGLLLRPTGSRKMACASWPRGMRELQGPPCLVLASSRPALDDPAAEPRPKAEVKSPQIATSR